MFLSHGTQHNMEVCWETVWRQTQECYRRPTHKPLLYYISVLLFTLSLSACGAGTASIASARSTGADPVLALTMFVLFFAWPLLTATLVWLLNCRQEALLYWQRNAEIVTAADLPSIPTTTTLDIDDRL